MTKRFDHYCCTVRGDGVGDALAECSDQGWEMVAAVNSGLDNYGVLCFRLFFKRPASAGA